MYYMSRTVDGVRETLPIPLDPSILKKYAQDGWGPGPEAVQAWEKGLIRESVGSMLGDSLSLNGRNGDASAFLLKSLKTVVDAMLSGDLTKVSELSVALEAWDAQTPYEGKGMSDGDLVAEASQASQVLYDLFQGKPPTM